MALINKLLPKYVRLPLLVVVVVNFLGYYLPSRLFVTDVVRYDLTLGLDRLLPFLPSFILIYVLSYVQWVGTYVFHCRMDVRLCYRIAAANFCAKSMAMLCFIFLPTTINRPEVPGSGIFSWLTQLIYDLDNPVNLMPSLHCLESWMCFRLACMMPKKNKWYIAGQGVFTLLVFASTVLVKQHFVLDIPAGILVCELGWLIAERLGLWRVFNKLQTPSAKAWLKANNLSLDEKQKEEIL